jgi:hypothetical protein
MTNLVTAATDIVTKVTNADGSVTIDLASQSVSVVGSVRIPDVILIVLLVVLCAVWVLFVVRRKKTNPS